MKTKLISIFTLAICIIMAGTAIAAPYSGKAGKDIDNLISPKLKGVSSSPKLGGKFPY